MRRKNQPDEILKRLKSLANPEAVAGMVRFGINPSDRTLGVSIPNLRKIARETGKDHSLAGQLWKSGIHEARTLAGMIDDPAIVTDGQLEDWVKEFDTFDGAKPRFLNRGKKRPSVSTLSIPRASDRGVEWVDSWDDCDRCCSNLFDKTGFAYQKAMEWSERKEEFVKRAGFVLMAALAVHGKESDDKEFEKFLPIIRKESNDDRNFVKKAVNWALRQIGKRSLHLNRKAIETAERIKQMDSRSARWIASDALRELTSEAVQKRLKGKTDSRPRT